MSTSAHPNHVVKGNRPPGKGRGASNTNDRGNTDTRRARKAWMIEAYRADRDLKFFPRSVDAPAWVDSQTPYLGGHRFETYVITPEGITCDVPLGEGEPACRCYRCGTLLTIDTVTVDKIFTRPEGGTYRTPTQDRRERATNCRPACNDCQIITGAPLAAQSRSKKKC